MITDGITDGTPGGNHGLVHTLMTRRSVKSASQTTLSYMGGGGTISATGKTKVLIRKVNFAG